MTTSRFDLGDSRALVTGASRGLGKAIALALADAGAVVACVSSRQGGTKETAIEIAKRGRTAWEFAADLSDRSATLALAEEASCA